MPSANRGRSKHSEDAGFRFRQDVRLLSNVLRERRVGAREQYDDAPLIIDATAQAELKPRVHSTVSPLANGTLVAMMVISKMLTSSGRLATCTTATSGLVLHSDRSSQYASEEYQALLKGHHVVCSMSRKGNCWDTQ